ncbi:hypothetical protein Lqui_0730 [Legionella quinlivanii]|uniref:Uncharacterized protein n=1 Tax=Legionella quinlivanii TaxID=45073 RepID=A0A0W0Y5L8_9GAMM|nr:hypothetical protein [Legionella quinlivanii]KTD51886.1 hypothetical protein Lqui_0730 [Legionella quinlivanii]MCW8452147.1 hypothetical protein [Legionella quinlivanii]SEF83870.1 hypothetical protein SAMN02746093_01191 [Legionella quinlivanii DSM 21216]STY09652.1 Uncharacterised protein [Legionella quinlivanii]
MKKLILHPTELSQWHALVNEAQASTQMVLNETTESYLVFLLMRFSQGTKLIESVIAMDFLESMHSTRHKQVELLRDVGDKSLLFCGLFPGMAQKRHVSLRYFSDMGKAAYLTVGELQENQSAELYFQLSYEFLTLQQILQAMRSEYLNIQHADSIVLSGKEIPLQ